MISHAVALLQVMLNPNSSSLHLAGNTWIIPYLRTCDFDLLLNLKHFLFNQSSDNDDEIKRAKELKNIDCLDR